MKAIPIRKFRLRIHPIRPDELDDVLSVYRQCEDFLSLGPVPTASMEMVLADLDISKNAGGIFCGIYAADGKIIGVVDFVPRNYEGDPHTAFLELMMLSASVRKQGIGRAVFEAVEREIRKDQQVITLLSGVQVNNPAAIHFWQSNGFRIVSGPDLMPDQTMVYGLRKDY